MIVTENVPDRDQMYHSKEELAMVNMNHYPSSGELRFEISPLSINVVVAKFTL